MSRIRCRFCLRATAVADPHLGCPRCGTLARGAPTPEPPPLPRGMSAREDERGLFIAVRWFRLRWLWLGAAVTVIDASLVFFYKQYAAAGMHWTGYVFGLAVPNTLALLSTYALLAILLNRTHITVEKGRLRAVHLPLRCFPGRTVPAEDVEQLFCLVEFADSGKVARCHVCVLRRNRRSFTLVQNLDTVAQARFIEHAVERHLGLEDVPVAGEAPKP